MLATSAQQNIRSGNHVSQQLLVLDPLNSTNLAPLLLRPGKLNVGSSAQCELRLRMPGVAATHCLIIVGSQIAVLKAWDPHTWLNEGPIREARLRAGDRLAIGPVEFRLRTATADELLSLIPETVTSPVAPPASPSFADQAPTRTAHDIAARPSQSSKKYHSDNAEDTPSTAPVMPPVTDQQVRELEQQLRSLKQEIHQEREAWQREYAQAQDHLARQQREFDRQAAQRSEQLDTRERACGRREESWTDHVTTATTARLQLDNQHTQFQTLHVRLHDDAHRLQSHEQELVDRETDVRRQEQQLQSLQDELEFRRQQLQEERSAHAAECQQLAADRAALSHDRQLLHEECEAICERHNSIAEEAAALVDQKAAFDSERNELKQEREALDRDRSAIQVDRDILENERAKVDERAELLRAQQEQLTAHESELATSQASLEQQSAELAVERTALENRQAELASAQETLAENQQTATAHAQEIEQLRAELQTRDTQLTDDRAELEQLRQSLRELQEAAVASRSSNSDIDEQALRAREERLHTQSRELNEQAAALARQEDTLVRQRSLADEQAKEIETRACALADRDEDLRKTRDVLDEDRELLDQEALRLQNERAELDRFSAELANREEELDQLRPQLEAQQQKLEAELASLEQDRRELESLSETLQRDRATLEADRQKWRESQVNSADKPDAQVKENLPVDSPPSDEQLDDDLQNLRSSLADMFDISVNKRSEQGSTTIGGTSKDIVEPADEHFAVGPDDKHNNDENDEDVYEDTESNEEIVGLETAKLLKSRAATSDSRQQSHPDRSPADPHGLTDEDETSIAAYMEDMMKRARQRSGTHAEPGPPNETRKTASSASTTVPLPAQPGAAEVPSIGNDFPDDDPYTVAPARFDDRPRHKQDKEAVRANLQSLREVANTSARSAVSKYFWKKLRGMIVIKGMLTVAAFSTAAVLLTSELWGTGSYQTQGWAALAAGFVAAGELARSSFLLHRLMRLKAAQLAAGITHRDIDSVMEADRVVEADFANEPDPNRASERERLSDNKTPATPHVGDIPSANVPGTSSVALPPESVSDVATEQPNSREVTELSEHIARVAPIELVETDFDAALLEAQQQPATSSEDVAEDAEERSDAPHQT